MWSPEVVRALLAATAATTATTNATTLQIDSNSSVPADVTPADVMPADWTPIAAPNAVQLQRYPRSFEGDR